MTEIYLFREIEDDRLTDKMYLFRDTENDLINDKNIFVQRDGG